MSKEFEVNNNADQTSGISYGFSDIRSSCNDLAQSLLKNDVNASETKNKTNTNSDNFDNPKFIMINNTNNLDININNESIIINGNNNIVNKYHSEINKDINYKKKYDDLLIKFKALQDDYEKLKNKLKKYEGGEENKSKSFNKNENRKLSITKLNSNDSIDIFHSSILNFDEINEDINESNISDINKSYINNKLIEIFKCQRIKKKKTKSELKELKEKEAKIQTEKREMYKSKNKIKQFRKKYLILDIIKYKDELIYNYLKENNFDFEKAFESLSKYMNDN
jgi:hypothetical protein